MKPTARAPPKRTLLSRSQVGITPSTQAHTKNKMFQPPGAPSTTIRDAKARRKQIQSAVPPAWCDLVMVTIAVKILREDTSPYVRTLALQALREHAQRPDQAFLALSKK